MSQWYRNIGIDLGLKSAHEVAVTDPDGASFRFRCGHGSEDLHRMLERVTRDLPPGGKLRFVMEPTDTAWVSVAWYVMEKGHEAYLAPSMVVHDFRTAMSRHAKSDRLDGETLRNLPTMPGMLRKLNRIVWGTRDQETLKRLVKRDFRVVTGIGDRKKRIEALVRLGLPTGINALDIFSPAGRYLCSQYFNPPEVVKVGVGALAIAIAPLASFEAEQTARAWYEACKEAVALYGENGPVDYPVLEWECRSEIRYLDLEEAELEEIREAIADIHLEVEPGQHLATAPGVGPVVAAAVAAAIGDPHKFPGAKQFRAYTGIVPKVSRSGVSDSKGQGITKAGPNWLKRQLYLAADWARRLDPQLAKVYYDQMVKYGHHHTHAVCAVATRLADRLFICYRDNRPYELRGLDGSPISPTAARAYIADNLTVPEEVRDRLRRGRRQRKWKTRASNVRANS